MFALIQMNTVMKKYIFGNTARGGGDRENITGASGQRRDTEIFWRYGTVGGAGGDDLPVSETSAGNADS